MLSTKLKGRYRGFLHTRLVTHARLSPLSTMVSRVVQIFTKDELTLTHHCYPKVIIYFRIHSWYSPFYAAAAAAKSLQSCPILRPQRRQPTRLPHLWDSPGKNTGVGCHFLLQCMKVKSQSEVAQSCPTLSDPMDCSLPGSSIHGIFQARVLEWGDIAFSSILVEEDRK